MAELLADVGSKTWGRDREAKHGLEVVVRRGRDRLIIPELLVVHLCEPPKVPVEDVTLQRRMVTLAVGVCRMAEGCRDHADIAINV